MIILMLLLGLPLLLPGSQVLLPMRMLKLQQETIMSNSSTTVGN